MDVKQLNLIPAQGSAAALLGVASGGIDIVLRSLPEVTALKAGVVKCFKSKL